jgi:hypothetical protein
VSKPECRGIGLSHPEAIKIYLKFLYGESRRRFAVQKAKKRLFLTVYKLYTKKSKKQSK